MVKILFRKGNFSKNMFSKPEPIVEDNLEDSPVKYNESFIIKPGKTNSIWVDGNEKVP